MSFDIEFFATLDDFDTAMLVTVDPQGALWSCPLFLGRNQGRGRSKQRTEIYFVTSLRDTKIARIDPGANAIVTMQGPSRYLALSGLVTAKRDVELAKEMWRPVMYAWIDGKDDPELALIRLVPQSAQYWDDSGLESEVYSLSKLGESGG